MTKYIFASLFMGLLIGSVSAQGSLNHEADDHFKCNNNIIWENYCKRNGLDPNVVPDMEYYKQHVTDFEAKPAQEHQRGSVYIIPVVFHVVHQGGIENISDAQILDALAILNRDFRKLNADTVNVVPAFKSIVADCEIEFRLAQKDAQGNCVSGITRTFSATTNDGDENMISAVHSNLNGGTSTSNIRFPRNRYMNVWICKNAAGAAGYTTTPLFAAFSPNTDGIVINHTYLGSIGTSSVTTSRALTHEVGHWLNLSHVWGSTNNPGVSCGDDSVTDTPETEGWSTCNTSGATCGNVIDNVQNYMEYSYCSRMFTNGQRDRMHTALNNGGLTGSGRNNLWTASNHTVTGISGTPTLCISDFSADQTVICMGDSIAFTDMTYHGATQWNWTFAGGTPSSSTAQYPVITYNTPGQYQVDLVAGNGTSSLTTNKTAFITVLDPDGVPGPIMEGFESMSTIPNTDWYLENTDGMQKWEVYTGAGSTGNKCLKLDNHTFNGVGAKDVIVSKTYDLTNVDSVHISFKYAYKQKAAGDNDKLKVFVSKNCGLSWSLRKQVLGSVLSGGAVQSTPFTPVLTDWQEYVVTNLAGDSTFSEPGFRFKIEFESDQGNNIYIDDINLSGPVSTPEISANVSAFNVYPNPFTQSTLISYQLNTPQMITVTVTDVLGKTILVDGGKKSVGTQTLQLNASQLSGSGIYFVNIITETGSVSRKLIKQ